MTDLPTGTPADPADSTDPGGGGRGAERRPRQDDDASGDRPTPAFRRIPAPDDKVSRGVVPDEGGPARHVAGGSTTEADRSTSPNAGEPSPRPDQLPAAEARDARRQQVTDADRASDSDDGPDGESAAAKRRRRGSRGGRNRSRARTPEEAGASGEASERDPELPDRHREGKPATVEAAEAALVRKAPAEPAADRRPRIGDSMPAPTPPGQSGGADSDDDGPRRKRRRGGRGRGSGSGGGGDQQQQTAAAAAPGLRPPRRPRRAWGIAGRGGAAHRGRRPRR